MISEPFSLYFISNHLLPYEQNKNVHALIVLAAMVSIHYRLHRANENHARCTKEIHVI